MLDFNDPQPKIEFLKKSQEVQCFMKILHNRFQGIEFELTGLTHFRNNVNLQTLQLSFKTLVYDLEFETIVRLKGIHATSFSFSSTKSLDLVADSIQQYFTDHDLLKKINEKLDYFHNEISKLQLIRIAVRE